MKLISLGSISIVVSATVLAGCASELGKTIHKMGYGEIQPPSRLCAPGSIISVSKEGNNIFADIVCPTDSAVGDVATVYSDSSTSTVAKKLTGNFKVDASYLTQVNASAGGTYVKNITLSLNNVHIISMSGDQVYKNTDHPLDRCQRAVSHYRQSGKQLALVLSVVEADVVYHVNYDASLSVDARAKISASVAGSLSATTEISGSSDMHGSALFWGLRDDPDYFNQHAVAPSSTGFSWAMVTDRGDTNVGGDSSETHTILPLESVVLRASDQIVEGDQPMKPAPTSHPEGDPMPADSLLSPSAPAVPR